MRVLVVEDTADIAEAVVARLEAMGHAVDWEDNGRTASELLEVQAYDLVVLDLSLPGEDGLELLRKLRARRAKMPVLVITARSAVDARVDTLDLGADDYLTKPFDFREFEARARALLRRSAGLPDNMLRVGSLAIDRAGRVASIDDRPLNLTRRELTVLEILAIRPERIVPKEELVEQLFNFDQDPSPNAVEQFVARLRRKLTGSPVEIQTLRGLGYRLATR
ncbi:response regulator transcription factor [Labrys neptuniae]|uniref:response regulator transcription factor n=1 Tax=Labrys neptuniae TaxID=376174 RepID=UPI00288FA76F|nr:response regulator transcription factor [Labrys neptuniae]MDT3382125.1 response regulator transcription factor [Labrys neptuniae]